MGEKSNDLREDIQNCFKLCNKLDSKYDVRYAELKDKQNDYASDVKLLTQNLETISRGLMTHIEQFEKHNDDEMQSYKEIRDSQVSMTSALTGLKNSIDNEIAQNVTRDERIKAQNEEIKKIKTLQSRFIRILAYVTGVVSTVAYLLDSKIITINLG